MSRIAQQISAAVAVIVIVFVAGNLCGIFLYPKLGGPHSDTGMLVDIPETELVDDTHDEERHVALSKQAYQNLGLRLGHVQRGEWWKTITVPGIVREIAGRSDLSVPAPVSGFVEAVSVLEGQSLGEQDHLFTLRITDSELTTAQSELLRTILRAEIAEEEIGRLEPLTSAGILPGDKLRELKYELTQLASSRATLRQEIKGRGLPNALLEELEANRSLASELTIRVPSFRQPMDSLSPAATVRPVSLTESVQEFSVEELLVHPGQSVRRGDSLCRLSYHAQLLIQGDAFAQDLAAITKAIRNGWAVAAELGHEHTGRDASMVRIDGLRVLRVDNRVDPETQTSRFYLPLDNYVVETIRQSEDRSFQQWQFKPGQRVHLGVPTEHWENQLLLPNDAVAVEGADSFVFAEHVEDQHEEQLEGHPQPADGHEDVFIEFEPVPVRILHRDSRRAVIADDGQLSAANRVALNGAYKLYLALKMQEAGGGGHHHHEH